MGGGEVNVAYEGTFGDLGAEGGALFGAMEDSFDFDQYTTDGFTAINGAGSGPTVSPRDIFNAGDSVPPSTAFTNLTTPGSTFLETPDEDYQTSPLFNDSFDAPPAENWYSLFPDDDLTYAAPAVTTPAQMTRTISSSSANQVVVHPGGEGFRKRSSIASPVMNSPNLVKHSTVAGVAASKRNKALPPIIANKDNPAEFKKARNTAAARKSRAKKVEEKEAMEAEIMDLKAQVAHWKSLALSSPQAKIEEDFEVSD